WSFRPNQVIAIGLEFPIVEQDEGGKIVREVAERLLTPRGLRTLCPSDDRYKGRYIGDPLSRDAAYHQGTVWPWLLGPYTKAVARYGDSALQRQLQEIIFGFESHFMEAGLGNISEIFDGDAPHLPRGCVAQAWSVAQILESALSLLGDKG
ncbi:MAG: hypothetical protein KDD60_07785, partial [Bdellovibrionales bacterium]|nr:hypothetical protein [Bdellovibrionales bacterium]